ncbi:non-ribosomal peptide synthetase [Ruminiclostridium josui]|uniref:non-ribosomal peptide synthetase n=1 Tax=Ruminiclostridium josui TaxID=1499 RepID=UPI0004662FCD|nr:non-ribosomal peptide synthetase [Ruminiclostridium josui]
MRTFINNDSLEKAKEYWINQLSGSIYNAGIMYDYPNNSRVEVKSCCFNLDRDECQKLYRICRNDDISIFVFQLAVFTILMHKYTGGNNIGISVPMLINQVLDFENCIVINTDINSDDTFMAILTKVKEKVSGGYKNYFYPIKKVIKKLDQYKNSEIFRYFFMFDKIHEKNKTESFYGEFGSEMVLLLRRSNVDLELVISYNACLFKDSTINALGQRFSFLFSQIIENPYGKIKDYKIITKYEEEKILNEYNNTQVPYPQGSTIHKLFKETAEKFSENDAVIYNNESLTYRQIDYLSDILACKLIDNGIEPGSIIGIMTHSSPETIVGLLAILKIGCAYLPLDPNYPLNRIKYMLDDSQVKIILSFEEYFDKIIDLGFKGDIISLNTVTDTNANEDFSCIQEYTDAAQLAYVIYTSGSTGNPKGVMIEHKGVISLVKGMNFIEVEPSDHLLMTGSFVFDITTFEVWASLLNGLTLHIINNKVLLDPFQLGDYINNNNITILHLIPQLFNQIAFYNDSVFKNLKYFLIGGDLVRPKYLNNIRTKYKNLKILHMYGPTENTTFSSWIPVDKTYEQTIPIGRPINNSSIYIMNSDGELQPSGVPGEIYVGGSGIARGYLNKPELTEERFVANPFRTGEKIYKTGDQGRWLPDGTVEFLGRNDQQVKIRGSRLEISEIEIMISKYEGIKEAIITVRDTTEDEKELIAYIVPETKVDTVRLRNYLSTKLPEFMIPSQLIEIQEIPVTPNGKVDYKKLAEFETGMDEEYVAPRDDIEEKISDIWAEILSIEKNRIGIDTDFFRLGGHSLKITVLVSRLYKEFCIKIPVDEVFKKSTIRQIAEYIRNGVEENYSGIPKAQEKEFYALASAQKRLYILNQMNPKSTNYNMTEAYLIEDTVDIEKLKNAFKCLIQRHESLRTAFLLKDEEVVQKIYEKVDFCIEELESTESSIQDKINQFVRSFDLSKPCLFRVGLISLKNSLHVLVIDMHHIISDGFSSSILINDIYRLYSGVELPALTKSYKDYAQWQLEQKLNKKLERQKQYWLEEFKGDIPVLNLITDYIRPDIQNYDGDRIRFTIEREVVHKLEEIARKENCSNFMLLMAVSFILFNKLTNQDDIVIGTVTSGRTHPDTHDIVGMFANTIPIKGNIDKQLPFTTLLSQIRDKVLNAFENQDYQFEDIIEDLDVQRNTNRNPLFDVSFVMQNSDNSDFRIPGMSLVKYRYERKTSKFDLTFFATENNGTIDFELEYCSRLFKKTTIERYIAFYKRIINAVIHNPDISIKDIKIISPENEKKFILEYNDTAKKFSSQKTIQQLFDKRVQETPDKIAIIHNSIKITYLELKQISNSLAHKLKNEGVAKGEIVGLMMNNSPWLIIAILGIIKSGATYLPIDPDFPHERKMFMLQDCNCNVLLTENSIETQEIQRLYKVINIDKVDLSSGKGEYVENSYSPEDLIYIIYTSGSTGKPKGCMIKQKGVVNYVEWAIKQYFENEQIYFPLYSSVAYDLTVTSIYTPLISGNTIVIYPKEITVLNNIVKDGVSNIIKATPTHLRLLLEMDCSKSMIKKIIVGGEQLTTELALKVYEKFDGRVSIYNEYGPTETVVGCMIHKFNPFTDRRSVVPIGIPAQNMQIYILDEEMNLCPIGVPGEIYIGGIGVSPGYIKQEELTNSRFVANRFSKNPAEKLYKSGDLGVFLEEGIIEYIGRMDSQIKIRGFRVELEEIERNILSYPGIKNVAIAPKEGHNNEKILCAYYVSENDIGTSDIRNYLSHNLPDYMIPNYYVRLDSIPCTPSGKADIRALPEPEVSFNSENILPSNEIEAYLYEVWSQNLNIDKFGVTDNYFDIGGNSFLLVKMHSQISVKFPEIKVTDFFKYPTIQALAEYLLELKTAFESKELDLEVALNEDFFSNTINTEKEIKYEFRLSKKTTMGLKSLAQKENVTYWDIVVSLFALLISDSSKNQLIKIQTSSGNEDNKALSIELDFSEIYGIEDIFYAVNSAIIREKESKLYKIDSLKLTKFKKNSNSIIPFIYRSGLVYNGNLGDVYDILIEVREEVGNEILFNCSYSYCNLREDKMEEFFKMFAGLLDNITV